MKLGGPLTNSMSMEAEEERHGQIGKRSVTGIAAALTDEGVYLRCRGEENILSPDEARRLAGEIEQALSSEDIDGALAKLTDWLGDYSGSQNEALLNRPT